MLVSGFELDDTRPNAASEHVMTIRKTVTLVEEQVARMSAAICGRPLTRMSL
jgi:hypothetical protein